MPTSNTRIEHDLLGGLVPADAYDGGQTARALDDFLNPAALTGQER